MSLAPCRKCGEIATRNGAPCPSCSPKPPDPPTALPTREAWANVVACGRALVRALGQLVRAIRADIAGRPEYVPVFRLVPGRAVPGAAA